LEFKLFSEEQCCLVFC